MRKVLKTIVAIQIKKSLDNIYNEKGCLFLIETVSIFLKFKKKIFIFLYQIKKNNNEIIQTINKLYQPKNQKIHTIITNDENQTIVDKIFWNILFCLLIHSIFSVNVFQKKNIVKNKNKGRIEYNIILKNNIKPDENERLL